MNIFDLFESDTYQPPSIDVGDSILVGKFKNRKAKVTGFKKDDNNQPVLKTNKGDQKLFKPRFPKLMENDASLDQKVEAIIDRCNFDENDQDVGTSGLCGTFAMALYNVLTKKGISAQPILICTKLNDNSLPKKNKSGSYYWRHVLIKVGDSYFDIDGKVNLSDVMENYCMGEKGVAFPVTYAELVQQIRKLKRSAFSANRLVGWKKALIAEATSYSESITKVLDLLQNGSKFKQFRDRIKIFGSVAMGKENPGDVDIMLDYTDTYSFDTIIDSLNIFLALAQKFYGSVDVFVKCQNGLYVRNENANGWVPAKFAKKIWRDSQTQGKTFDQIVVSSELMEGAIISNVEFQFFVKEIMEETGALIEAQVDQNELIINYVESGERGSGYRSLKMLLNFADKHSMKTLLAVLHGAPRLIEYYTKLGFSVDGVTKRGFAKWFSEYKKTWNIDDAEEVTMFRLPKSKSLKEANHWGKGPQAKFLDLFNAWEKANSIEEKNISVEMGKEKNNIVYLDNLWVPIEIRYQGWGTKVMQALCDMADKTGVRLRCEPLWQDDEDEPPFSLWSFYGKFGFEPKGNLYVREPKKSLREEAPLRYHGTQTSHDLNYRLRDNLELKDDDHATIKELDAMIAPLDQDMVLWRGVKSGFATVKVGSVISDAGYVSTSTSVDQAKVFALGDGAAVLRISVKKGTPVIDLRAWEGENEIVIPRGSRYKVDEIIERPGRVPTILLSVVKTLGESVKLIEKSITQTPQFKSWFRKSKAVKNGQPMVFYHGTTKEFRAFDPKYSNTQHDMPAAFFFTNKPDVAQSYAGQKTKAFHFDNNKDEEEYHNAATGDPDDFNRAINLLKTKARQNVTIWDRGAFIMPVYLRMEKPLRASGNGYNWNEIEFEGEILSTKDLLYIAKERGCDSIIIKNVHDRAHGKGRPSTIVAVFSPDQVKSAMTNTGTYGTSHNIDECIFESMKAPEHAEIFKSIFETESYVIKVTDYFSDAPWTNDSPPEISVEVLKNPSYNDVVQLGKTDPEKHVRMMTMDGTVYAWGASTVIHPTMAQALKGQRNAYYTNAKTFKVMGNSLRHDYRDLHLSKMERDALFPKRLMESNRWLTLYRGEYSDNKGGKFWSEDKEFARQFTQSGRDSEIMRRFIHSSDVYDHKPYAYAGDMDAVETVVAIAQQRGFSAVRLSEARGRDNAETSIYVFDRSALKFSVREEDDFVLHGYHGTGADIQAFASKDLRNLRTSHFLDIGIHFSLDPENANTYAFYADAETGTRGVRGMSSGMKMGNPVVYPVTISPGNMLDISKGLNDQPIIDALVLKLEHIFTPRTVIKYRDMLKYDPLRVISILQQKFGNKNLFKMFRRFNVDSIKYKWSGENIVVFDPSRVKFRLSEALRYTSLNN